MFNRINELDDAWRMFDDFRREVDRYYQGQGRGSSRSGAGARLEDVGNALQLTVDLPGVKEGDVDLSLENQTLTLSITRKADAPKGYAVHRQERAPYQLSRSFTLPTRVNPEKVRASLADGLLTVAIEKAPEFQPRKIAVQRA